MTPIIGITTAIAQNTFRVNAQVGYEYIDKIEKAGGIPLMIPLLNCFHTEILEKIVDSVDGIIFSGGENIDSLWYGEEPTEKVIFGETPRNNFERELFLMAKNKKKPILGICRGHQLINVLQGGSLYQNIESQTCNIIKHFDETKKLTEKLHEIIIESNSVLYNIYKTHRISVNSFHVQGIKNLGMDLRVTAKSVDGIPEAIEYLGDFFMVGVQYHPEALEDHLILFRYFIENIKNNLDK